MVDSSLITAQALAKALNLSVETIWRYTRENRIPFIEFGPKKYRYRLPEVVSALAGAVKEGVAEYRAGTVKKMTYLSERRQQYWIVDPESRTLECFHLSNGMYALLVAGMDDEELEHPSFSGLKLTLSSLLVTTPSS
jgi:excisionase family DNA binding protein